MSLYAGLDREMIQELVGDFIAAHAGVPDENVIYIDFGANEPGPVAPYVTYLIKPDTNEYGPHKWREEPSLEYWRVAIVSVTAGFTYTVSILGVDYSYVALIGDTIFVVRDAIVSAIPSVGVDYKRTATGTLSASIDIESDQIPGLRLKVTVNQPVGLMTKTQFQGDIVTVSHETVEIEMDIECAGNYNPELPTAEDSGAAIASRLQARFRNQELTSAMREQFVVPVRSRQRPGNQIVDDEQFSMGRLIVTLAVDQAAVADNLRALEGSVISEGC